MLSVVVLKALSHSEAKSVLVVLTSHPYAFTFLEESIADDIESNGFYCQAERKVTELGARFILEPSAIENS